MGNGAAVDTGPKGLSKRSSPQFTYALARPDWVLRVLAGFASHLFRRGLSVDLGHITVLRPGINSLWNPNAGGELPRGNILLYSSVDLAAKRPPAAFP